MEEEKYGFIYGLTSPVTFKVRYVGKSTRSLQVRLNEHWSHSMNNRYASGPECAWIQALADEGLRPSIVCLKECPVEELDRWEQHFIAEGLRLGWNLLNLDKGGAGRGKLIRLEPQKNLVENIKGENRNEAAPYLA